MKKEIVIVGGGTAGWLTASHLYARGVDKYYNITLIESPNIGSIGVGESTIPEFNKLIKKLGINIQDVMRECGGVIKDSITFDNFYEIGHRISYGFGNNTLEDDVVPSFLSAVDEGLLKSDDFGKTIFEESWYNEDDNSVLSNKTRTRIEGIQLDAGLLAKYLHKNLCANINHIQADVSNIVNNNTDGIDYIVANGMKYNADLFVDCSGFKSILINQTNSNFIQSKGLLNDRAIVARTSYKDKNKEMISSTLCTAMSNGWIWKIPLWNDISNGYAYSSKYISDHEAEKEFRHHLGHDGDVKIIHFKSGYRDKSWCDNVVATGLSGAFIEPLESTGLWIIAEQAKLLAQTLQHNKHNEIKDKYKHKYNQRMKFFAKDIETWIHDHYAISNRTDTAYWRFYSSGESQTMLKSNIDRYIPEKYLRYPECFLEVYSNRNNLPLDVLKKHSSEKAVELYKINQQKVESQTRLTNYEYCRDYIHNNNN